MQKWEYATLCLDKPGKQILFQMARTGEQKVGDQLAVVSSLNQLGDDGWELCSTVTEADGSWTSFFKRPTEGKSGAAFPELLNHPKP